MKSLGVFLTIVLFLFLSAIAVVHAEPAIEETSNAQATNIKVPTSSIQILTPRLHPQRGDHWNVRLKTTGRGNLTVVPRDQATIGDLQFYRMICGTEERTPTRLLHGILLFKDWQCDQEILLSNYVSKLNKHSLRFLFRNDEGFAYNTPTTMHWAKRLGGANADTSGRMTAIDSLNRVIIVGTVNGNADLNGDGDSTDGGAESSTNYGGNDIVVSVIDSSGNWVWAKRLGGTNADAGYSVAVDSSDNIVVVGVAYGNADMNGDGDSTDGGAETGTNYGGNDAFISKFSSSGTWSWAKRLGGTNSDIPYSVAVDTNNAIIVTGTCYGNADMNGDGDSTDGGAESSTGYALGDAFISKFDSSGTWSWAKRLGGANATYNDTGWVVTTDSSSNVYVGGYIFDNSDLNGDGDSTDGGAETVSAVYGSNDAFISVFSSAGVWSWAKRMGGTSSDGIYGLAVSSDYIILVGSVVGNADLNADGDSTDGGAESNSGYGAQDAIITIFNSSQTWLRAERLGSSTNNDYLYSATLDSVNNMIYLSGITNGASDLNGDGDTTDNTNESTGNGHYDAIFLAFDISLSYQWSLRLGSFNTSYGDYGLKIARDNNGSLLAVGYTYGDADLNGDRDATDGGAESSTGYGGNDIYVVKFGEPRSLIVFQ